MRKGLRQGLIVLGAASILPASPAMGQAAQTWVSGTGTNNGNCTRAQPCRTFAAAYAVTATGGQIQVLNSGEFGRFDIKKSITIKADGAVGSVVVTAFNGFNIDAPSNARIVLEGLDFDGSPNGAVGILILGAREVIVRDTTIRNFSSAGIYVNNLKSSAINLTVDNALIHNAQTGIRVSTIDGSSTALVRNSVIVGTSYAGISAGGAKSRVEITGNAINRTPQSIAIVNGGVVASYGDNVLSEGDEPSSVSKR